MTLVRCAKGRCPQTRPRDPGGASDPRGAKRAGRRQPRGCGPHVACDAARDVSLAGALPSRWMERPEGEAAGGTAAKAGRRHAEMALPDGDPEEPAATEIPVRALDPGDGGRADREKVCCPDQITEVCIDMSTPLYLAIAGRDEAGEAIGGREPAAPRGDRAREKEWRPVHRFQRAPEQSPGPQTEPAFARTGDGTACHFTELRR